MCVQRDEFVQKMSVCREMYVSVQRSECVQRAVWRVSRQVRPVCERKRVSGRALESAFSTPAGALHA